MNLEIYWIWFATLKLLPIKKYNLIQKFKIAQSVYFAKEEELLSVDGLDLVDISEITQNKDLNLIKEYEKYINKMEIKVININDKLYPESLKNIYDPPMVLFMKGNVDLLRERSIAIVGSREANTYGLNQSYMFSYELAKSGVTVISGLAKGVDKMAHVGALKANGSTIAVIGSGLDIVYPKENYEVYRKILEKGLIISEFIVGERPLPQNFPMRNRIISALSEGVLVVQAREKSGAIITADFALEQGKNVYAVPR